MTPERAEFYANKRPEDIAGLTENLGAAVLELGYWGNNGWHTCECHESIVGCLTNCKIVRNVLKALGLLER